MALGNYSDYAEIIGEGHMHTVYSGGPSSVADCAQKAQERGLDWIFITDYNTIDAAQNCTEETNETFITGLASNSTSIFLKEGWNLVGYPSFSERTINAAMVGVPWTAVQYFDSADLQGDFWKHNHTTKSTDSNDLQKMRTGRGYWVLVISECIWTVFE